MEENVVFNSEDVNQNKVFGVLAYIGFLFLVPLFAAKDSQYARFHTNQGIVLFILECVLGFFGMIVNVMFAFMPFPSILASLVGSLISLVCYAVGLVFMILGIVNACSGEAKKLPIIGSITILK